MHWDLILKAFLEEQDQEDLKNEQIKFYKNPLELVVDLLFEDQEMVVHVVEPDEVRPLQVVLDEANYAAAPLVPSVAVAGTLAVIYLETMTTLIETRALGRINGGIFFLICSTFKYCAQNCFICRPSDSTVSEDAGIEPGTVATSALTVRRSNHWARSHPLWEGLSSKMHGIWRVLLGLNVLF